MPGDILKLGPFTGGLNKASDRSSVLDNELVECINYELDLDGSLITRPAIKVLFQGASNARFLIFGSAEFSGVTYLFGTQSGKTFVSANEGSSWTELNPGTASRECKCLVQYQGKVWLPATPTSANGGINWDPVNGATAVAAMPRGVSAVEHKNRMYICPGPTATSNESRLHFSDPADFTTWPGTNFIDVSGGDGQTLNEVIVYQDNLLLFKDDSTFVLAYDLSPSEAILREINSVIGVDGPFQVTQHENTLYCFHGETVYEIVNYEFGIVNLKLPLEFENSLPTGTTTRYEQKSLSIFGDRLVVRYFNKTYVLGLRTKTWSEWKKTDTSSTIEWHIFGPLIRAHYEETEGSNHYVTSYSFDVTSGGYKIIHLIDGITVDDSEGIAGQGHDFEALATSKDFDMGDPIRFKRLYWWGADVLSGNDITGSLLPITLDIAPTWNELQASVTYNSLETWGRPLTVANPTETIIAADNNFIISKSVKFLKAVRFRKVNFSIKMLTDGSSNDGPCKLFSMIAVVRAKQVVTKASN